MKRIQLTTTTRASDSSYRGLLEALAQLEHSLLQDTRARGGLLFESDALFASWPCLGKVVCGRFHMFLGRALSHSFLSADADNVHRESMTHCRMVGTSHIIGDVYQAMYIVHKKCGI